MKTFKELFAGTGIEPTTNENGGVDYNFKATLKTNAEASDKAILLTPKGTLTIGEEYSSPSISFYKNNEVEDVITINYSKFMYKGEEVKDLQTIYDIISEIILNQNKQNTNTSFTPHNANAVAEYNEGLKNFTPNN